MCEAMQVAGVVDGGQFEFWCPVCGCVHYHGTGGAAAPDLGHRVAHCRHPRSPYRDCGYELTCLPPETPPKPRGPFVGARGLGKAFDAAAAPLQRALRAALFGLRKDWPARRRLRGFTVDIDSFQCWSIVSDAEPVAKGSDLLSLAGAGYAAPEGIVAVMALEALFGVSFDSATLRAITTAVTWAAAGRHDQRGAA